MTAEITIMNKEAVALAADSAITAGTGYGRKIFTTGDKIFALSQNRPVGVMVYNNAQFTGVPWATVIYEIGKQIPICGFDTLEEYVRFFLSYFEKAGYLFPEDEQKSVFSNQLYYYFSSLLQGIVEKVSDEIKKRSPLSERAIQIIISKVIKDDLNEWVEIEANTECSSISLDMSEKIIKYYRSSIQEAVEAIFQKIPISRQARRNLFEISRHLISFGGNEETNAGVVIAGFGEKEAFPSVKSFTLEGLFNFKLKYFKGVDGVVGENTEASIIAFAQREMVSRFMEGVDPDYRKAEEEFMSKLSEDLPKAIVKQLKKYNAQERKKMLEEIKTKCQTIFDEYRKGMDQEIEKYFTDPITDVVAILPKTELATLAESLVSLTSIKRKFSRESETVSEPIDVAVISKNDGFVWIKKKMYY